ncbi:uncharacterized protein LOC116944337, partial [Petromyzon marinus]|uniref:uncharacterized protein LOC116944337 n=1 Tax=Petromyzon marinus TaxID=7757 RepID=UPI003F726F99
IACPSQCSCSGTQVNCHERSLASVPAGIPTTTQVLYLYTNQITKLEPGVFDSLTALVETRDPEAPAIATAIQEAEAPDLRFALSDQLTARPSGVFDSLTQLTYLTLRNNQLTALPEGVFDRLVNLQQLYLHLNRLSSIPAGMFDKLTNLKELKLYSNQLTALPEGLFNRLMNIDVLELCCNKFTQLPTGIAKLTKLSLALQGNQLKSVHDTKLDC